MCSNAVLPESRRLKDVEANAGYFVDQSLIRMSAILFPDNLTSGRIDDLQDISTSVKSSSNEILVYNPSAWRKSIEHEGQEYFLFQSHLFISIFISV